MYDRKKVDYTDAEHEQAEKLDVEIEATQKALKDGFQALEDSDEVIGLGWAVADVVRTKTKEFFDREGRMPRPGEIGVMVGTVFMMLERDNRWLGRSRGATSN